MLFVVSIVATVDVAAVVVTVVLVSRFIILGVIGAKKDLWLYK